MPWNTTDKSFNWCNTGFEFISPNAMWKYFKKTVLTVVCYPNWCHAINQPFWILVIQKEKSLSSNCLFNNKKWKESQSWDLPDLAKSIASRTWIVRKNIENSFEQQKPITLSQIEEFILWTKGICFTLNYCFQASKWPLLCWKRKSRKWGGKK